MLLAILLLLLPQLDLEGVGDVWLKTEPDILVYLDGKYVGTTDQYQNGFKLRDVPAGSHEITLKRGKNGVPAKFRVNVVFGQITELEVPGITLRAGDSGRKGAVEIRLDPYRPACSAVFQNLKYQLTEMAILIDAIPPGEYPVSVTCSGKTLNGKAVVLPGEVVIIRADFRQSRIGREGSRSRVTRVEVADKWAGLTNAPIPANAKRAIINAMRPGISLVDVKMIDRRRIAIAFRATRSAEVSNLVSNLRESAEFYDVRIKQGAQRAGGYDLSLILTVIPDESDSRPLD